MRKNFGVQNWLYPQPVLIISTYDENGKANAMNAAWGGVYDYEKIILCLSAGHKTTKNILAKGAFTVSIADSTHVIPCDYVGLESGNKVDNKLEKAGFTTTKGEFVDAPIINELPLTMECKLIGQTEDGNIIGQIVNTSVDERILGADGKLDVSLLRPISYAPVHHAYHVLGEKVGNAFADGAVLK